MHKTAEDKKRQRCGVIYGVIFFLIGLVPIIAGYNDLQQGRASLDWPKAPGKIISSSLEKRINRGTSGGTRYSYIPKISYEYSTPQGSFTSPKVSFDGGSGLDRYRAEARVEKYPGGKAVDVYYDPLRPELAVLEPGLSGRNFTPFFLGSVFCLFGVVIFFAAVTGKLKPGTAEKKVPSPFPGSREV